MSTRTFADFGIELGGRQGEVGLACPKCSHARRNRQAKCLSVNTGKGIWICHHCDWRGSLEFGEDQAARPQRRYVPPYLSPLTDLPREAIRWFEARGIPERVLARNRIQAGHAYFAQFEEHRDCVLFPYYRGAELVNIKFRATADKAFRLHGGAERILYGLNDVAETTIIVEGELDKLACEVAGCPNCVSVPDGAPPPNAKGYATKFDYLDTDAARLDAVVTWILAVDGDDPGKALQIELVRRLRPERCRLVKWPDGCKDANDVLMMLGHERLRQCIDEAEAYPIEGLITVRDREAEIDAYWAGGMPDGVTTGWSNIDELYTIRPGQMTVITGVPAHGKSEFLDALTINLIDRERGSDWRIAFFTPENAPLELHFSKLAAKLMGQAFRGLEHESLEVAKEVLNDAIAWIQPEDATLAAILDRARIAVARRGISGLVIDPWNEVESSRPYGMTESEHIGRCLREIKRFAAAYRVHVWIVAHPAKPERDKKTGLYPVPTPYDIAGSANWRNKADICITVWRDLDADPQKTYIYVQKVRFRAIGKVGKAYLQHDEESGRFSPHPDRPNAEIAGEKRRADTAMEVHDDYGDTDADDDPTDRGLSARHRDDALFARARAAADEEERERDRQLGLLPPEGAI